MGSKHSHVQVEFHRNSFPAAKKQSCEQSTNIFGVKAQQFPSFSSSPVPWWIGLEKLQAFRAFPDAVDPSKLFTVVQRKFFPVDHTLKCKDKIQKRYKCGDSSLNVT